MGCQLSIPCHSKNVERKMLYSQIKLAGLTIEEYLREFK